MNRTGFMRASAADDDGIRALLAAVPMEGDWRIGFGREPSVFACPAPAGMPEQLLVARRDGSLLSVGSWSEREAWSGGGMMRLGYLHGLRMAPATASSMRVLRDGYAELSRNIRGSGAAAWFTSIDASNTRARRVLECRSNGLPRYSELGCYRTRLVAVPGSGGADDGDGVGEFGELALFLNACARRHELALAWDASRCNEPETSGFGTGDVRVIRHRGRIVAAAGVWDQRRWKQVILHGCPKWWDLMRPVLSAAASCMRLPRPPVRGSVLAIGHVFPFAVEPGMEGCLARLWRCLAAAARAKGVDWLALGLDALDPLWNMKRAVPRGIDYRTILYQVTGAGFPDRPLGRSGRMLRPECATL